MSEVQTEYWAAVRNGTYFYLGRSKWWVALHGSPDIRPVSAREVQPGEVSKYWGWLDSDRDYYSMVWPSKMQVEMCFPYGPKVEEERGRGRLVNLVIEPRETQETNDA